MSTTQGPVRHKLETHKSTNGRFFNVRSTAAVVQTLSPALAGRLASHLFFSTRRSPVPAADGDVLKTGAFRWLPHERGRLAVWSWGNGPAVILVHGWNGWGGQLSALVEPLVAAGFRAVAFDAPAHGRSSGHHTAIPAFGRSVQRVAVWASDVRAIVAHSLGGAAVTFALSEGMLEPARLVYMATPVDPVSWATRFSGWLGLNAAASSAMRQRMERYAGVELSALHLTKLVAGRKASLLVVHDRGDRQVPHEAGSLLTEHWPGARLLTTEGLGHTRILRDPSVVEAVVQHIAGPARVVSSSVGATPSSLGAAAEAAPVRTLRDAHLEAWSSHVASAIGASL